MKHTLLAIVLGLATCVSSSFAQSVLGSTKTIISLSLNNVPMKEAARLIGLGTSCPIVVTNEAAKVVVDIHLRNMTTETALKSVCQSAGLWYMKNTRDGILQVMTADEFKGTLHFDRSERVEVVQILYPSAKDIGDALSKLYVDRVIWTTPREGSGDGYADISRALRRMDLLGKRGTFDIVEGEQDSGDVEEEDEDEDTGKKTEAKEAMKVDLKEIDPNLLRSMMSLGTTSAETIKTNILYGGPGVVFISVLPENNCLMLRSVDGNAVDEIMRVIKQLDKPSPQVLLEVKVLSVLLDDGHERAVDFLFGVHDNQYSGGFSNGSMTGSGGGDILKPSSYVGSTGAGLIPLGSGLNPKGAIFNAVSDHFKMRLQFLETNERVTQLATPNLMVSNNESTTLFIGTETTVMEKAQSTTTYTEMTSGGFQPNVSWEIEAPRRKIGTSLLLQPKIHADRSVTLRLLQEKSSLGQQTKNTYSGGTASEGSEEQYFVSQDIDLQRIVTTTVGKDQEFMVIGGMIHEELGKSTEKIPWLCEIPVIGDLLFTRMASKRQRKEILIIVRPFVMMAPGEVQDVSQDYLEKVSQHPVAVKDMPSLGVSKANEIAKPKVVNPNAPWYRKLMDRIHTWKVDDDSEFEPSNQLNRENRRENHQEALKAIESIQKNEK